jgi:hypothetical protein
MNTSTQPLHRNRRWLLLALMIAVIALLAILLAKKITQLSLPGLGVPAKTIIIEPQCPTPEQKTVIDRNLKLYGAGFTQGYDNLNYAKNMMAMAKTLGYPEPTLDDIQGIIRFLRAALKKNC